MKANLLEYCLSKTNPEAKLRKHYPHIDWDGSAKNILTHLKNHKQLVATHNQCQAKSSLIFWLLFGACTALALTPPIILSAIYIVPLCTSAMAMPLCFIGAFVTTILLMIIYKALEPFWDDIENFAAKGMYNPRQELCTDIPSQILASGEFRLLKDYKILCQSEDVQIKYSGMTNNLNSYIRYVKLIDLIHNSDQQIDATFPNLSNDCKQYLSGTNIALISQDLFTHRV